MASPFTRSSRRSEGLTTRSATRNNVVATQIGNHNNGRPQNQSNIGRKKRSRDSLDDEKQIFNTKRQKVAIEIDTRPKTHPKTRSVVIKSNAIPDVAQRPPKHAVKATQTEDRQPTKRHTNHHEKVVNGIKHELDRLQPNTADLKGETRKLRSEGGTRFKSELSQYFPEYDEVIGNEPKEDHILNLDTPIIIVDSAKTSAKLQPSSPRKTNGQSHTHALKEFPDSLFDDLHDAQRVDFSFLVKNYKEEGGRDPLSDEYFESIHRKPERQEKSIRNTDKGRAQHEKDQVIRLLEGLQGHDWLKLMGVSGITDSRKKDYEPARAHFIKGCEMIIEKFRIWREEEKRRKLERELAMAEEEEDDDEEADKEEDEEDNGEEEAVEEEGEEEDEDEDEEDDGDVSDGDPPDYSDVDASAARQLHEEAIARSAPSSRVSEKKTKAENNHNVAVYELEKDFKSFFAKPYLRDAALGKHRRSGRSAAAWGHPVPELPEVEFDLPEEYRDEEILKVHARRKRRDRRVSKT